MTRRESADAATARLVQSATQGDAIAMRQLLEASLPQLRAFVRLNMGPLLRVREEPEDIEQSVCREVLADLSSFTDRGVTAFRQWLYLSALRKLRDRAKFYGRERRTPDREHRPIEDGDDLSGYASLLTPSHVAVQRERVARLHEAFEHLTEEQRSVITMSKMLGMDHAEIAAQTGRTPNSVAVLLHRGLAKLGILLT